MTGHIIETLATSPAVWAHVVEGHADELHALIARERERGTVVRVLRGSRATTKQELFDEWSAALQFPEYFGENWDAFEECLEDAFKEESAQVMLVISRADQILPRAADEFATFVSIAQSVSGVCPRLTHVFHAPHGGLEDLIERLRKAGLAVQKDGTVRRG